MPDLRYYTILVDPPDHDRYFRVDTDGGVYSRWDADNRAWVNVIDRAGRDYLSRAIENGDGVVRSTSSEIALLR